MFVFDNTQQSEGPGDFFKNFVKSSGKLGKKLATNVSKNLQEDLRLKQTIVVGLYLKIN